MKVHAFASRYEKTVAGAADIISTVLFLGAGVAVFAYYQAFPHDAVGALMAEKRFDYVFPHFIRHELPAGLRGLLIAGLLAAAMSSLDSALNALASTAYVDIYKRFAVNTREKIRASPRSSRRDLPRSGSF